MALLAGLAVLLVVNGAGVAIDRWRSTDGFGLRGQPTPAQAWQAFTAASCLFKYDFYLKGGKDQPASCPDGTRAAGPDLGSLITSRQPRETLQRWYGLYGRFEYLPRLEYEQDSIKQQGDHAALHARVILPQHGDGQDTSRIPSGELWCATGGRSEAWDVVLEAVPLGGWKVARVDVSKPIQLVPSVGSPCDPSDRSVTPRRRWRAHRGGRAGVPAVGAGAPEAVSGNGVRTHIHGLR